MEIEVKIHVFIPTQCLDVSGMSCEEKMRVFSNKKFRFQARVEARDRNKDFWS
jgi:hypothetical protein